ncbi:MAG TPA: glycosyltransferase family 9 protein [Candidatus Bathyarchaeia archaeon]|nr:glycosyltransferase family 9 protein [Candidatus Bathyarchaeia archaeon]
MNNILLIRTDRIGDVVLTTPAIHALRLRYPQSKISILVSSGTVDLVKGNPDLDDVLVDDRRGRHKGFKGFWRLVFEVRARQFDTVVNFHTKRRTNVLCALAGIPRRIGYGSNKFGFLLNERVPDARPRGLKHEAQYCLDLLTSLGVEGGELKPVVPVQAEAEQWAEKFFARFDVGDPDFKFVVVHPGASCPTKRWPVEYFARVISQMDDRRRTFFIVIGTADQDDLVLSLWSQAGRDRLIYDLTGQTTLAQTVSLLKRCNLLISNDSGPVHLAAAFDRPVVSIFTRNQPGINPERWRPLGPNSVCVAPPVDLTVSFAKGEVGERDFLFRVTPEQVLSAVDTFAAFRLHS